MKPAIDPQIIADAETTLKRYIAGQRTKRNCGRSTAAAIPRRPNQCPLRARD